MCVQIVLSLYRTKKNVSACIHGCHNKERAESIEENTQKNTHNHKAVINLYKQTGEAHICAQHAQGSPRLICIYGLENFNNVYSYLCT